MGRKVDGDRGRTYTIVMDDRRTRGPAAWYDEHADAGPFAAFYHLEPSENPTVRPRAAPAEVVDPLGTLAREENLVIIARRLRPTVPTGGHG